MEQREKIRREALEEIRHVLKTYDEKNFTPSEAIEQVAFVIVKSKHAIWIALEAECS